MNEFKIATLRSMDRGKCGGKLKEYRRMARRRLKNNDRVEFKKYKGLI